MKINEYIFFFFIIFIVVVISRNYYREVAEPRRFADDAWRFIQISDIKSVAILPALTRYSPCCLTVRKGFSIVDKNCIDNVLKEMHGSHCSDCSNIGKWVAKKRLKLLIETVGRRKFSFFIEFHNTYKVADYLQINNADDVYCRSKFNPKRSRELYRILMDRLEKEEIEWVNSIDDCWKNENVLEYKSNCDIECGFLGFFIKGAIPYGQEMKS